GGVGGEGEQRRGYGVGHCLGFRRGRFRRAFAVGGGGAVFELAFGHFAAVGVDHRVDRRARGGDRARRLGFDRGREVGFFERFERFVFALAFAAGVGGGDAEVVGGVGCVGDQLRRHLHGGHPRPPRRRA